MAKSTFGVCIMHLKGLLSALRSCIITYFLLIIIRCYNQLREASAQDFHLGTRLLSPKVTSQTCVTVNEGLLSTQPKANPSSKETYWGMININRLAYLWGNSRFWDTMLGRMYQQLREKLNFCIGGVPFQESAAFPRKPMGFFKKELRKISSKFTPNPCLQ